MLTALKSLLRYNTQGLAVQGSKYYLLVGKVLEDRGITVFHSVGTEASNRKTTYPERMKSSKAINNKAFSGRKRLCCRKIRFFEGKN